MAWAGCSRPARKNTWSCNDTGDAVATGISFKWFAGALTIVLAFSLHSCDVHSSSKGQQGTSVWRQATSARLLAAGQCRFGLMPSTCMCQALATALSQSERAGSRATSL